MRARFARPRRFRSPSPTTVVLVLIVIIVIVMFFMQQVQNSSYDLPDISHTSSDLVIGLRVDEIDPGEIVNLSIESWKKDYIQRYNVPIISIALDYIYVSQKFLSTDQICFYNLSVSTKESSPITQSLINEEICNVAGLNFFLNQSTRPITFLYDNYSEDYVDPYFYPFDSRKFPFLLAIDVHILDKNNQELSTVSVPSVSVAVVSQRGKEVWLIENSDQINNLKLTSHRPLIYIVLSSLMLPVIFIAILSLLFLAEVPDKPGQEDEDAESGYWEVAVGILGIWSIQEVLLPEYIDRPTIVGDIILALYLFLACIILFIFVRSLLKQLKKKTLSQAAPVRQSESTEIKPDSGA